MNVTTETTYSIAGNCLRCGACAILAPGIIAMGDSIALVVRQPSTRSELVATDAAMFNCPVLAIRKRTAQTEETPR
jgi:ferredoxin